MRCLMAGLVDQLARRRESGKDTCDLTEQREGKLVRESAVQDSPDMSGDRALRLHDFFGPAFLAKLATALGTPQRDTCRAISELQASHMPCNGVGRAFTLIDL